MLPDRYLLEDPESIASPAFIYYRDILLENTRRAIALAGGADRLWPHIKTHKTAAFTRLQMELGVGRFKCATIAEAEMLAQAGAGEILLAYPLVGPNIRRYIRLAGMYPELHFYAIGDDEAQLAALGECAARAGMRMDVLLDINMGMNRTGVVYEEAVARYAACAALRGISMVGLHCYDGHHSMPEEDIRAAKVREASDRISGIQQALREQGLSCGIVIVGGTPSFPCHAKGERGWYLSPGTIFVFDAGYAATVQELELAPGAAVLTRVISHPNTGLFTLDLGSKGIAADPPGARGVIIGLEHARPVAQSEEHWVFAMPAGREEERPPIGDVRYVIPTHICPTSALYPSILVAEEGYIVDEWEVTARNRKLTI